MPASIASEQFYAAARRAMDARAPRQAIALLDGAILAAPDLARYRHLLGIALAQTGDLDRAIVHLARAAELEPGQPAFPTTLADVLALTGQREAAERAYRTALAKLPGHADAIVGLARLMQNANRPAEALALISPVVGQPQISPEAWQIRARSLKALGRPQDALADSRLAAQSGVPGSAFETAGLLRELGHSAQAEQVYRDLLRQEPTDPDLLTELASLVFARDGDLDAAQAILDTAQSVRWSPFIATFKAKLFNHADHPADAYQVLTEALRRAPNEAALHVAASTAAAFAGEHETAYRHAERASAIAPRHTAIRTSLVVASLGSLRLDKAEHLLASLRVEAPHNQQLIALEALLLRLRGDPRYHELYDYERFVRTYSIGPPPGWDSLDAYLSDLATHLNAIHDRLGEPLDQSLRHGSQTIGDLLMSGDPLVTTLFDTIGLFIAEYSSDLGPRAEDATQPLAARNVGPFSIGGSWSVRLTPGGRHTNHVHPSGWLSSAFYVDIPTFDGAAHAGWLSFGEPSIPLPVAAGAEYHVEPQPGRLVLFPSYMWHGTVPFGGHRNRLTIAFDVMPGRVSSTDV